MFHLIAIEYILEDAQDFQKRLRKYPKSKAGVLEVQRAIDHICSAIIEIKDANEQTRILLDGVIARLEAAKNSAKYWFHEFTALRFYNNCPLSQGDEIMMKNTIEEAIQSVKKLRREIEARNIKEAIRVINIAKERGMRFYKFIWAQNQSIVPERENQTALHELQQEVTETVNEIYESFKLLNGLLG
ncbi:MAG: hypothetical protein ABIG95_02260 [Candidatus Woesearchaeota archaeon]